ncbi:YhfG family protein [Pseudomonas ovata]|uniref:YhfG family protein n=1 Tax=Pseudomonas ovata TaxID=1839709 RepID=UPI000D68AE50|nr:YhfG family protein [Pseudomonas ovata]
MSNPSLQAKKAYCAKTRRSNYLASLRLAGFEIGPEDMKRPRLLREELLEAYRAKDFLTSLR